MFSFSIIMFGCIFFVLWQIIIKIGKSIIHHFYRALQLHEVQYLSHIDFNDSYYLELANLSKWKIVTDDTDFVSYKDHDVEIITMMN